MDIPMKAKVECADGPGGYSTRVVIDPTNRKMTHVVVKERRSPHSERLVPIRYISDTTGDRIRLRCSRHELSEMRALVLTEYVQDEIRDADEAPYGYLLHPYVLLKRMAVKHRSIPPGELGVRRGARVRATNGPVGRVDEFVIDPDSGNITHLVLQEGHLWDQEEVMIPITEIERIEERTVHLALDRDGVKALPAIPVHRKWL